MKKYFINRLAAIDWIANHAEEEGQFEILREQLTFNYIYSGKYFIEPTQAQMEVVWLDKNSIK